MTREHFLDAYHYYITEEPHKLTCSDCVHCNGTLCKLMIKWNCPDATIHLNGRCFNHELGHFKPDEQLTLF